MGSQDQAYAVVAPGWRGKLPVNVTRVDCPAPLLATMSAVSDT